MSITLSPSRLKTYATCPQLYHWQYNLKLLQPFNKAYIVGTKYHELVEKFHNNEPLEIDDEYKDVLSRLIEKYKKNPVEGVVVDTEKRFSITVDWVTLNWVIDRLDTDKIVEYKTSSFDYTEEDAKGWQTDSYIWWLYKTTWQIYPMVYSVVNKTKAKTIKYIPQVITIEQTKEQIESTEKRLINVAAEIESWNFEATPWDHCSYCAYGSGFNGTRNCIYYCEPKKKWKEKNKTSE